MHISQLQVDGLKQEYKIIVPANDIEIQIQEKLHSIGKNLRIPGFRPGKAPLPLLKQRYGAQALEDVLDHAVKSGVGKVIKDHHLRQAAQPNVSILSFDEGKDLEIKIDVEVLPHIDVQDFIQISLEKLIVQISDEEVDKKINELASSYKKYKPLDIDRPTQKGDRLSLDFTAEVDEKPFLDLGKQMHLTLGEENKILFPNIESAMEGIKCHSTVVVKDQFPENFQDKAVAKKPIRLHFTLTKIEEPLLFQVNEDFAREMKCDTLEDLKQRVRESLTSEYTTLSRLRLKRHLLDKLSESYTFDLPETLVAGEFEGIWKRLQEEIKKEEAEGTLKPEDDRPEEEIRKEYRAISERRVRLGLLISEIAQLNKIQVSDEEIRNAIVSEAMKYPHQTKEVINFYSKNPRAIDHLTAPLLEDKVVDFILSRCLLSERKVNTDELINLIRGIVPGFEDLEEKTIDEKEGSH